MLMGFINQLIIHFIYDGPTMTGWWYTYPSEKYESVGMMTFPTEWKVINNSMVPLLIIISHYIILYTIKNTIIFHYSQLNGTINSMVPVTTNQIRWYIAIRKSPWYSTAEISLRIAHGWPQQRQENRWFSQQE